MKELIGEEEVGPNVAWKMVVVLRVEKLGLSWSKGCGGGGGGGWRRRTNISKVRIVTRG